MIRKCIWKLQDIHCRHTLGEELVYIVWHEKYVVVVDIRRVRGKNGECRTLVFLKERKFIFRL